MNSQVKIYRVLNERPSIYVEIIDAPGPVDFELYVDSTLIETVCNKNSHHVFELVKSGMYSVVAKLHDSSQLHSNSLYFFMENFQPNVSLKSLAENRTMKFSVNEPEIDDINEFYNFSYITIDTDPVVDKPDGGALDAKFLYQLDHIGGIPVKATRFLHQNGITFLHLHTQQISPGPLD